VPGDLLVKIRLNRIRAVRLYGLVRGRGATTEELELLYRARFETFLRVASAVTRDPDAGRDAVQSAFVSAVRNRRSFRGSAGLQQLQTKPHTAILSAFGFPKLSDPEAPYIDGNFVPHVRGHTYRDIGSTGALTLISLAWILAIFEQALEGGYPHPGFLLIDSPQKNLTPADTPGAADEFRDPAIVQRVWEHIIRWSGEVAGLAQIIVVDNRPPEAARAAIVREYSGRKDQPPYGLIDDEASRRSAVSCPALRAGRALLAQSGPESIQSEARKLHKRLHTHRTRLNLQVGLNAKAPTCGAFAEPSNGLEPLTPSLPSSNEEGNAGTAGKPRAQKPRKKKDSPESE